MDGEAAPRAPAFHLHQDCALRQERDALFALASACARLVPSLAPPLARARRLVSQAIAAAAAPAAVEAALDAFAQALRHRWITSAALAASRDFRTPLNARHLVSQTRQTHSFGYERALHPDRLEQRCHDFFPPLPPPWQADHLLWCSGQAAMTGALLLLEDAAFRPGPAPARIVHRGGYFETASLLRLFPSLLAPVGPGAAFEACIAEPVWCDGRFGATDLQRLARDMPATARLAIIDDTLRGRHGTIDGFLSACPPSLAVIRIHSGLKLFQSGLEFANVGLLSIHATCPAALARHAARLRAARVLLDGGLRLADLAALEFPGFLDPGRTCAYEAGIFEANAALARAVAASNRIFVEIGHVAPAPYCSFRLRDPSAAAWDLLETRIRTLSQRRQLRFDQGGSFGFRGHRYEVVRPDGQAPFLRVAMGRRGGWSRDGVIALLAEIAAGG